MKTALRFSIIFLFSSFNNLIFAARTNSFGLQSHERKLSREKRFLIFNNGGVAKFIGGYLGPIDTPLFINCNAIRNFQYQFNVPPNVTTIFTKVPARQRSLNGEFIFKSDSSRKIAYDIVEQVLTKEGRNGRECILRAICEVAETPVNHNGLIGELVQLFFTPGKHEKIHQDYLDARKAGISHVNCEKIYANCPLGHGILDSFSLIHDFGLGGFARF
ncbi:CLUMA_CG021269, isoform A [Clunio marinus]|uniref:CLUMA_CG021269, isoform A n=1 Tax=Clunio marinus TaxID=568069 RepID=A0A1J1JAU1_9DIPT|nr:CLUMA_CG021269, isoform A [Clunio marinus]